MEIIKIPTMEIIKISTMEIITIPTMKIIKQKPPQNSNDGKPNPLLDAAHLAEHHVHVDEDQHVAKDQLVRILPTTIRMIRYRIRNKIRNRIRNRMDFCTKL